MLKLIQIVSPSGALFTIGFRLQYTRLSEPSLRPFRYDAINPKGILGPVEKHKTVTITHCTFDKQCLSEELDGGSNLSSSHPRTQLAR